MSNLDFGQSLDRGPFFTRERFTKKRIISGAVLLAVVAAGSWGFRQFGIGGTLTPEEAYAFTDSINKVRRDPNVNLSDKERHRILSGPGCADYDSLLGIHIKAREKNGCPPGQTSLRGRVDITDQLVQTIEENAVAASVHRGKQ
jgi:hypothetical protein